MQAANAIQALTFVGSCTNIGGGIQSARSLLDSAVDPKAVVLLSDGYQNCGTPPLGVLPSYPIYSCAMGPNADLHLMQQIATQTGGQYDNAPYPSTMMFIYNQIRGQPAFVNTIQNRLDPIPSQGYKLVPAGVGSAESETQFGIVWDDSSLVYTSSANPGPNQISITLVQPSGQIYPQAPDIVGSGYVVFNVASPTVGTWYAQVISGSGAPQIQVTIGAFEFPAAPEASPRLSVEVAPVDAGRPLEIVARVRTGERPVGGLEVHASVVSRALSVEHALERYRDDLARVAPDEQALDGGMPEDRARLATYRRRLLPRYDVLAHRSYPAILRESDDGTYRATVEHTQEAGSYNFTVSALGKDRREAPVHRTEYVSALVVGEAASRDY